MSDKYKLEQFQYIAPHTVAVILNRFGSEPDESDDRDLSKDKKDPYVYNPAIIMWFANKDRDNSFILNTETYSRDKLHAINMGIAIAGSICDSVVDSIEVIGEDGEIVESITESSLTDARWSEQNAPSTMTVQ